MSIEFFKKFKSVFILIFVLMPITFFFYRRQKSHPQKINIVLLSMCSVSSSKLPIIRNDVLKRYPNFENAINNSFVFRDAFTDFTWSNIRRYLFRNERLAYESKNPPPVAYPAYQEWPINKGEVKITSFRVPKTLESTDFENFFSDRRIDEAFADFTNISNEIKAKINNKNNESNLFIIHYKFMHFPYLPLKAEENNKLLSSIFNSQEYPLVMEYLNHPENYPDKLAFFQAVFTMPNKLKLFQSQDGKFITYINSPESIDKWKHSANYEVDVKILNKAYEYKLKLLDQLIGKWNLFYKQDLEKNNTVFIISGDHGESFLEHGELSHNVTPYDEAIRFFYFVHYPYQEQRIDLFGQISQQQTSTMVEGIMKNEIKKNNIAQLSKDIFINKKDLLSFNCAGDKMSMRSANKWKLIYLGKNDSQKLYDLENDPHQLIDVSNKYPDVAANLKYEITERLSTHTFKSTFCVY